MDEQKDANLLDALVVDVLRRSFKEFGIERTEDIFRSVYANSPKVLALFQDNYNKLLKGVK
jgi:hypothetical protein